jgi:heat shock protein HtpX
MPPSTPNRSASGDGDPTPDATLAGEMAATLALVVAVDVAAVTVFAYLLAPWIEPLLPPGASSVLVGGVVVCAVTAVALVGHLRYAGRGVLDAVGAERVDDAARPELRARLTRLAAQFGLRPPALAVVESDVPNSLAVGGPRAATVVVSRGLLDALGADELDAVLAHELAHVKNRDATVMTLATALPALANGEYSVTESVLPDGGAGTLLAGVGLVGLYAAAVPRLPGPALSASSLGGFAVVVVGTALLGSVLLGLLAAPAVVLTRRLSRRRELVADRAGARATGDPATMASAIRALADVDRTRRDLRAASPTLRGLCFLPHGFGTDGGDDGDAHGRDADGSAAVAARTHPSVAERLSNLRAVAASLEGR